MSRSKIIQGLEDAVQTATCQHRHPQPFHRVIGRKRWHCPDCGATFNYHPSKADWPSVVASGGDEP